MGWYESYAKFYDKRGNIDRKAEMRSQYKEGSILKDALVGSTYYAAIKIESGDVGISVCLTSVRKGRFFSYKPMDASMGPYKYDCPESILKLNTLHGGYTDEWIAKCRAFQAQKKRAKKALDEAHIIEVTLPWDTTHCKQGDVLRLSKWYSKKSYYWLSDYYRYTKKMIEDFFANDCVKVIK